MSNQEPPAPAALAEVNRLQRAVALDPSNAANWQALGLALFTLRRFEEALLPLEKALALSPSAILYQVKGSVLEELGQRQAALQCYTAAIECEPVASASTYWLRGSLLARLARNEEALTMLRHAVELDPNEFFYSVRLAEVLVALKRTEEAAALCETLAQRDRHEQAIRDLEVVTLARYWEMGETLRVVFRQALPAESPGSEEWPDEH